MGEMREWTNEINEDTETSGEMDKSLSFTSLDYW